MPELPEVEVLRLGLERSLIGCSLVSVDIRAPMLREPVDAGRIRRACVGRRVVAVERRAKYLQLRLEGDSVLVVHLGMSGRLWIADRDQPICKHEHASFLLSSGRTLRFRDPRRFGLLFALPAGELATDRHFVHLGVEPLGPDFSGPALRRWSRGRRAPVKNFLMDSRIVVGLGNIYTTEALFAAGVHPLRAAGRISSERFQRLADAVQAVLRRAIDEGGTTLRDFRNAEGNEGYFQVSLAAYGRKGQPCPKCGELIRRIVQAGRSTFYCLRCQR